MRYVRNNEIYTTYEIRQLYPNLSIPENANLEELGFIELIESTPPIKDGFYAVEVAPINNVQTWELREIEYSPERAILEADEYLKNTDWIEPYLLRHEFGKEIIPPDSEKWEIINRRADYKLFLKNNKGK